jgi:hypothetical protein
MSEDKRQSSPRGLIVNVTPAEPGDEELRPQSASERISFWREFARATIEVSGKNPDNYCGLAESEILDHICAAARLIKQLDKVESLIGLAKRHPNRFIDAALGEALLLPSFVHQLTIADNERSIWKGEQHNKTLRQNAKEKANQAQQDRAKYQARADELLARHKDWSAYDVAKQIEREERRKLKKASETAIERDESDRTELKTKLIKANTIRRLIRKK